MDFKQLEYIIKIADEKSITKAAEKLFLTQPALNQQLLRLEKELGTQLFVRGRKSMELTAAGEIYVKNAKQILDINKESLREIAELMGTNYHPIRIGLTPERGLHVFSGMYPDFHKKYPQVPLQPMVMSVKEQLSQMENGNLDYGLITVAEGFETDVAQLIPLRRSGFVLAIPAGGHMAKTCEAFPEIIEDVHILDALRDDPTVTIWRGSTLRKPVDDIFKTAGVTPNILFETESNITIIRMVQSGMCYGIVPDYYRIPAENIRYYEISDPFFYDVVLCRKRKRKQGQTDLYMEELIREFLKKQTVYKQCQ